MGGFELQRQVFSLRWINAVCNAAHKTIPARVRGAQLSLVDHDVRANETDCMTRIVEPLLGTRAELQVRASSAQAVEAIEEEILAEVARLESIFSVFDEHSELHRFRRTGLATSPELLTVLALAEEWQTSTDGALHSSMHPLFDLWEQAETLQVMPTGDSLRRVVEEMGSGWRAALNLNAIAKGWIAERAVMSAFDESDEVREIWLSLGGDLVHRGEGAVVVGIEDPHRPWDNVAPMATVEIAQESLATSGRARRWWSIGGQRYSQVLDPRTGRPVDHVASATVIAEDAATADALATVAVVLDVGETLRLVEASGGECFLVHSDGTTTSSSSRFQLS